MINVDKLVRANLNNLPGVVEIMEKHYTGRLGAFKISTSLEKALNNPELFIKKHIRVKPTPILIETCYKIAGLATVCAMYDPNSDNYFLVYTGLAYRKPANLELLVDLIEDTVKNLKSIDEIIIERKGKHTRVTLILDEPPVFH